VEAQTATLTINQAACNATGPDGIVTVATTGLTMPITYQWQYNGTTNTQSNIMSTSNTINDYAGTYLYLSAIGANNNIAYVSQNPSPPFTYVATTTPSGCNNMGSINTVVTGTTGPYTYSYYDLITNAVVSTANPASVPDGQYGVEITDANGCKYGSEFAYDSLYVGPGNTFVLNTTVVPANCTNGSITINSVSGGTAPYTYVWSNASTASSITNLSAGSYSVVVTDATNCTETHFVYVQQAIYIGVQTTPTPATCTNNDGAAIAFGTGGQPPYTYLWSGATAGQSISNIVSGGYIVMATDANGCSGQGYAFVGSTTPITATVTKTPSSCTQATGSATLTVNGGQAPYTITWGTSPAQSGLSATNLSPGNYSFNIVDVNGCVRSGVVNILPVNQINIAGVAQATSCTQTNGAVNIQVNGGTAPYTYAWSNSATSQNISSLPSGGYSVLVTDAIGCTKGRSFSVLTNSPVGINFATTPSSCIYDNDGSITAIPLGGTPPYTWNYGAANNPNLFSGWYSFSVTDANGCHGWGQNFVSCSNASNSCYCVIKGTAYHDVNGNCIQDANEPGMPNIQIYCSGFGFTYTNSNGDYEFKVPSGTYTISETIQTLYPLAACQNNANVVTVVAANNCSQTVNFANTINPIRDIKTNVWSVYQAVPGFNYQQKKIVTNMGTVPEANILTGYKNDGQIGMASFSPSQPIVSGGNDWYENSSSLISLNPGFSSIFNLHYTVPANLPISTALEFQDSVSYSNQMSDWLNDYTPWDNVKWHTKVVVGSYDPNFKEVSPQGEGPEGEIFASDSTLDYMVHFQNLGTYYAQNVVVIDTLDPDLDWTTLRPVYQSHPCQIAISDNGVARFEFKNIMLPAKSQNEPASHGMLSYEIKTKRNLPLGTQFKNKAEIYFDFNPAIVTNTTVNTLVAPASLLDEMPADHKVKIYPNPTSDNLFLRYNNRGVETMVSIYDISGKLISSIMMQGEIGKQTMELNTNDLAPGLYIINLKNEEMKFSRKFIKKD